MKNILKNNTKKKKEDYTKNKIIRDIACFFYGILHGRPFSNHSYEDEILDLLEEIAEKAVQYEMNNFSKEYPKYNDELSVRNQIIDCVSASKEEFVSEVIHKWKEIDLYEDLRAEIEYLSDEKNVSYEISKFI